MKSFWIRWHEIAQNIIKVLFFFVALYMGIRLLFLGLFWSQWWGISNSLLMKSLWYGLRINLKSAGIAVLIWVILNGPTALLGYEKPWLKKCQNGFMGFWIGLTLFLGISEIPYFQYMDSGYHYMMLQVVDEKWSDLLFTVFANWSAWILLTLWLVGWYFLYRLWKYWMSTPLIPLPHSWESSWRRTIYSASLLVLLIFLAIFCRFGGSLTYSRSLHWENYAVTGNNTLDEAILDNMQGLYRVWNQKKIISANAKINISGADLSALLKYINPQNKNLDSLTLSDYILRESKGPKISKPRHIFIILGESQGEWPLLPEYQELHLADGVQSIVKLDNSIWIHEALPNGPYTTMGIQSVVIGLADAKQTPQFQKETFRQIYETGIAPQMAKLGYQSNFWYGGAATWEGLEKFVLSQGFNYFYSMGDLTANKRSSQNVWGIPDQHLFQGIEEQLNGNTPSVNVIMTTSNHAPYSIDYVAEGFPVEEVKKLLTPAQRENKRLLDQLGHYWYADREISKFVTAMQKKYPDSLFVITGDHGTRVNLESASSLQKKLCVPIIISGPGISTSLFPTNNTASQLQIIPTLIELIAPQNFTYYSLLPSLTEENYQATNSEYWMSDHTLGSRLSANDSNVTGRDKKWEEAILAYSWWRVMKGNHISP